MQQSFSPDRLVTKGDSVYLKRTPLAVISYANNEKPSTSKAGESTILCKRIDNSAHFVDVSQQAQPAKKFTPLAIPLEAMKRKNVQQTNALHARVSVTEPAEYVHHHHTAGLDTQPLHTETSESGRNTKYKNIPKERVSASVKSRSKTKQKDPSEKKGSESKLAGSKPRAQIKDMLKGSDKLEKRTGEGKPPVKRISPRKTANVTTTAHRENLPPPHMGVMQKTAQKGVKPPQPDIKPQFQTQLKKVSVERKSTKSNYGAKVTEPKSHEKTMERSPLRDTTELDKFVKYNAMKIMEKMKEQKLQDEFERRLNEERKVALNEGNRRIREANYVRFNASVKPRVQTKPNHAWGADQRRFERQPRSSSSQKRPRPKIEDEDRRKVLGLENLDEEQILRLRQRALISVQEALDRSGEQSKPKRMLNEEEHEAIQRYMLEKRYRLEEEMRSRQREEYDDYMKKRKNLEILFTEIRESRELLPRPKSAKKKTKKRTKKRKTHKEDEGDLRIYQAFTEPNDPRHKGQLEDDDENYSMLYNQYKEIIKAKTSPKEERASSNERKTAGKKKRATSPKAAEKHSAEQKKKGYKEKYEELSDRYQKQLAGQTAATKVSKKGEGRGSHKGRQVFENERNEAQKIIMEMDTDNFSDNDYIRSESMVINSDDRYHRGVEGESDESQGQDIPDNSAREIIEAAAIFIQKNYRGYRTRKILTEYINQLNQLYQEELELEGQYQEDSRGQIVHGGEYYEGEEEDEEDPRRYLQQQGLFGAQGHKHHKNKYEEEDDEVDYEKEGHGEINGEEFVADDEKQSLRSLLEKQKLELHDEYQDDSRQHEEDEEKSEEVDDRRVPAQHKYKGMAEPQYNMFYGHEDIQYDENGEVIKTEDYSNLDQDQIVEDEYIEYDKDAAYYAVPSPRRARSDGEILDLLEFDMDQEEEEEEDDEDNQISLHNDGEDDYEMLVHNKRYMMDKGAMQDKYLEELIKEKQRDSRSNRQRDSQGNEYHEESGEEYQGHPGFDPRMQKGYLQGYGDDYGDQDEEGYIHESNYDVEYAPEDNSKPGKSRSMQHNKRYSEEQSSHRIENGTPDDEQQQGYLGQQQGHRPSEGPDNEKMVMISTINSDEEEEEGVHYREGQMEFRNIPQRRIKSDIINRKPEPESYTQSQRDTEERKSQVTSQRESQAGRLSQKDQVSSRYQVDGESQDAIEGEHEGEEHVSVDMLDTNDKLENADSEHFREELIQELSHYTEEKSDHQEHGEERRSEREEKVEEIKVEENMTPQRPSHKVNEKVQSGHTASGYERPSVQRSTESNELYQAELHRLKEEQAMKWEQMMTHLSLLTSQDELHLNKDLKAFIETLQKQSEINKRQLTDDIDTQSLLEAQASVGQESHSTTQGEANFFNITQPSHLQKPLPQGAQNTRNMIASNMPPASKKLEMVSPLQESKYGKKKKPFGFAKKTNLQIDINAANEENNNNNEAAASAEQGPLNLDLSQMRLVLGSEQLLREQSARTLSHSLSVPSDVESVDLQGQENPEGTSIFERDPFKEFTRRKFKELLQQENMKNLIKMREQALEIRHKTHLDHMTKMLETRRVSPRTFQNKKIELEKWINKEREIIQKTKRDIEKGWLSTADSIQRTQRDLMFLQKLGANAEGRNTNTSGDISLRHSFTDEDNFENVESQSERLSKRSLFGIAAELRTPSSSKNIKIIDKFELKDNLLSPQVAGTGLLRAELETKEGEDRIRHIGEVAGSGAKAKETEEVEKHEHGIVSKGALTASEKKVELQGEEKDQLRKESPRKVDEDEQVELQPEEMGDEEIEWENEALQSPLGPDSKADHYTPGKSAFSSRKDAVSPPGIGEMMPSTSSNYSPKSQEDLRFMIQEKLSNIKPPLQEEHAPVVEEPIKEVVEEEHALEQHELDNIQAKTDLICKDIMDELFTEMGEEFAAEGKEHIWNKVALMGEEPPAQSNLQNMIENNYFFHGGAEHVNFQANIPMPLSPSSEYFRLQQEKHSSSLELTPEQQIEKQYQDAQSELLKTLGIKTEVAAVTKYLDMVIEEIKGAYKENFLRNINTPLGFSTSEKLNNMRNYDLGASESSSLAMSSSDSQLVLEIHVYFKIEERIMEEDPNKNEVSTELEHIHNKMIFDCINEILDAYRPFGLNGQPFPWKVGSKILKCQEISEENMISILEKMKMKIIDWASYLCGYYGEGDEFVIDKTQSFIDEYLAQVREERILRMLSEEIFELENKWITYDDEEAEVELEIADLVFDKMVTEAAELIAQIYEKKQISPPESKGNDNTGFNPNARKMNQRPGFSDITKIETDLNFNSV